MFNSVDANEDVKFEEQNGCSRDEMKQISARIWEQWQLNCIRQGMRRSSTFSAAIDRARAANDVMAKVEAQLGACSIAFECESPTKMARNSARLTSNSYVHDDSLGCDMQSTSPLNLAGLPVMDEIRQEKVSDGSVHPTSTPDMQYTLFFIRM